MIFNEQIKKVQWFSNGITSGIKRVKSTSGLKLTQNVKRLKSVLGIMNNFRIFVRWTKYIWNSWDIMTTVVKKWVWVSLDKFPRLIVL